MKVRSLRPLDENSETSKFCVLVHLIVMDGQKTSMNEFAQWNMNIVDKNVDPA